MNNPIKLVGLENLWKPDYQVALRDKIEQIFGDKKSINIKDLQENSVFNQMLKVDDKKLEAEMFSKIEKLAGTDIDMNEMQAIYCLLDSFSEKNQDKDKKERPEKYVFDTKINLNSQSALFKIEKDYNEEELKKVYQSMVNISKRYEDLF